jgi:spore maturation protein CgeB
MLYLKQLLKKIPPVYSLNARIKAARTVHSYHALSEYYQRKAKEDSIVYREGDVASLVKNRLAQRGVNVSPVPKGNLRLFWVCANYDQDSSGIIQGLQKLGEVILFESRPIKYEQIWPEGSELKTARQENSQRILAQVKESLKIGPVHAVIGQMWAHTIDPDVLNKLQEMGLIVVNISMDDRHAFRGRRVNGKWTGTAGLIGSIDLACTAAKECCLWYLAEGCPSIYLPEASDPELFKPLNKHKLYDVSFVGKAYGIRSKIVKAIEKTGVHVKCFGSGWPNGIISTYKMPELFARSRIVLGIGTISHCTDFYALKMRDFDGPMSGSLYITHDNPDLYDSYEVNKEIITYGTPDECAEKIRYYLANADEREKIAKAGRLRAEKEHTWEKRFEKVFRTLELISA